MKKIYEYLTITLFVVGLMSLIGFIRNLPHSLSKQSVINVPL